MHPSVLELKKNCPPELIIYIVGSKADLYRHRQVTSDLARLSLHNWFPPPTPPPPPPPPAPSTLSYIRPRFTSFPGLRSPPFVSNSTPSPVSPEGPAYLDLPPNRSSALQRSKTAAQTRTKAAGSLTRSTSTGTRTPQSSRFGSHLAAAWNDNNDNSSNSIEEAEEDEEDDREWGLSKGMELFEVSAKDDIGTQSLPSECTLMNSSFQASKIYLSISFPQLLFERT
jgi:GTPase SAR1 family protein